jgi:diguanylate cyclase (GGDEF)-like protein/PAS domain S-box-containing protein
VVQGRECLEHHPQDTRKLTYRHPTPKGQIVGIDHVQVAMPAGVDAERAAERFYGDVLGLRRVTELRRATYPMSWVDVPRPEEHERAMPESASAGQNGCWFQGPCVAVHLRVDEPFQPLDATTPLAVDDIDSLAKRVANNGFEWHSTDEQAETRRAHTRDPFGNRIELVEAETVTPEMLGVIANFSIYPVVMLDYEGTIRWAGASVERFFGYPPDELTGRHFGEIICPESLPAAYEAFASVHDAYEIDPWGGVGMQVDLAHADGHAVSCELAALTTRRTGMPWYVVLIRQAGYERALDQAVETMASGASLGEVLALVVAAVEQIVPNTGVAVCDRWMSDHFAVTAGSATSLLTAQPGSPWSRALATGEDVFVENRSELPGPLAALAKAEGYEACWVHPVALTAGEDAVAAIIVWRRYAGSPSRFNVNTLRKVGQLLRLTLQWDRSHRSLEFAATHDSLTGLANRQAFHERMEAVSKGGDGQTAVLYLDLDRFKPVNDQLGHQEGDRVLAMVAERLLAALRPGDLVARMGGDEFAVLCERLGSPAVAERVAERLLDVVGQPLVTSTGHQVNLGVSIGVADVHGDEPVGAVLARADEALREAKETGRGRWVRA